MTPFRVVIAQRAAAEIERASAWWNANRPSAPAVFVDELHVTLDKMALAPSAGTSSPSARLIELRRLLMPKTRYHIYYTVDVRTRVIKVRALWHANRGRGPRLG